MKKFSFKEIAIPTLTLFLIGAICTAILGFTNQITKDTIAENSLEAKKEARQVVFDNAANFSEKDSTYSEALDKDGKVIGYVIETASKGYGGDIVVMTGIDVEGNVTGIEILSIEETAGLGMNAKKDDFKKQYVGADDLITVDTKEAGENKIKALTGATITSKAVTEAVNEAMGIFRTVTGGDK